MDLDNLKQLVFGTNIKPAFSQDTLVEVIFWPDAFLLFSFLFSLVLTFSIHTYARRTALHEMRSSLASALAISILRFMCFVAMIGAVSATSRMFLFIFGESANNYGNQAAVTIFSAILLIPAFFCASLVFICGAAMYFLLGLKLQK